MDQLLKALSGIIPADLVQDLVTTYSELRRDVATSTLGRNAPGKFVETVV